MRRRTLMLVLGLCLVLAKAAEALPSTSAGTWDTDPPKVEPPPALIWIVDEVEMDSTEAGGKSHLQADADLPLGEPDFSVVPEPSALMLLALCIAGLAAARQLME